MSRSNKIPATVLGVILFAGLLVGFSPRAQAETRYTIVELGTLGGAQSREEDINNSEPVQIVGASMLEGSSEYHAFKWTGSGEATPGGEMENLGEGSSGCTGSDAYGLNDAGQVVGKFVGGACSTGAFLWSPTNGGEFTPLDSLAGEETWDEVAIDVNGTGTAVGEISFENAQGFDVTHAVTWASGSTTPTDMHSVNLSTNGDSFVGEINAGGTSAGTSYTSSGDGRAVYWPPGQAAVILDNRANDGSTDYAGSTAGALNDDGDVVGSWGALQEGGGATIRASVWPAQGTRFSLGLLPGDVCVSRAHAINNADQVVGVSIGNQGGDGCVEQHGFLWENGEMLRLSDLVPGGEEIFPMDINDRGEILGRMKVNGVYQSVLLTFGGTNPELWDVFALDAAPVTEGGGSGGASVTAGAQTVKSKFVVKRSEVGDNSTIKFATKDDTAKAGKDYVAKNGTLTFGEDVKKKIVYVKILNNNKKEQTEKFFLVLSKPSDNLQITDKKAKATIRDDD